MRYPVRSVWIYFPITHNSENFLLVVINKEIKYLSEFFFFFYNKKNIIKKKGTVITKPMDFIAKDRLNKNKPNN